MNARFLSIVAAAVIAGGLMVYQATRAGAAPVLLPSQVLAQGATAHLARVRIVGDVAAEDLSYVTNPRSELRFRVHDPKSPTSATLPVVYLGVRPDMFTAGRSVILDGEFTDGVLQAHSLLTQCPSKYEAPAPGSKAADGGVSVETPGSKT